MRRHLIRTPHGHVHVRDHGPDDASALLAVHWTPLSGRMWNGAAAAMPDRRLIAPDLLGYGMSDARPAEWRVEDWADGLAEALDALRVTQADVAGGHMGAAVAAELALRHPMRVRRLVLDGVPLMTPELRAAFAGLAALPRPGRDGAETLAWERTVGLLREYLPGFDPAGAMDMVWATMRDWLATGFVSSAGVAARHDVAARLPLITHPTLLITAERDTLAATFAAARAMLPGAAAHRFEGNHPVHFAPDRWADIVARFLDS